MKTQWLLSTIGLYLRLALVCTALCPLFFISIIVLPSYHSIISWIIFYGSKALVWAMVMPIDIKGSYSYQSSPSIIVANHQSIIDIPLIASTLPAKPYQWLYKHQLNATPLIGRWFNKIGIGVSFSSFKDGIQVLRDVCKKAREHPYSFIVFPEGARFVDGTVHNFMPGFGLIAQKLCYPVQPIYIHNAGVVCPPGSFSIHYIPVKIIIGPAFIIAAQESVKEFVERVHQWFLEQEQACASH